MYLYQYCGLLGDRGYGVCFAASRRSTGGGLSDWWCDDLLPKGPKYLAISCAGFLHWESGSGSIPCT